MHRLTEASCRISIALLVSLLLCVPAKAQTESAANTRIRIDNYLTEMDKIGYYGSVLVEMNDEKLYSRGFGFSDKQKQIKNSEQTIFDIGSITKQFTAAGILLLETQGKLKTDDKISQYFENVPEDKQSITIHDLLRHQSGLISNVGKDYDKITSEEFLKKVFSSELKYPVGTQYKYSNIGYSLLAMIIEKVSGKSYEAYLYENLWKPAKMETTGYTRPSFDYDLIAVGYSETGERWGKPNEKGWDPSGPYWNLKGNGGILSTTGDLYKWHRALLSYKILPEDAVQKMYQPKLRTGETKDSYYAYGWDVHATARKTKLIGHNGTNHIFYADFTRFIDEGISVITLSNKFNSEFNEVGREISRLIFDKNYKPEIPIANSPENRAFTNDIIKTISESGLEKAKDKYKKRNKKLQLIEAYMRSEGFRHIDEKKPEIAMGIFEMNAFVYPNSAKALQGLGEGYMETGKKKEALEYLKKSLAINADNPFVTDMIKKLEE